MEENNNENNIDEQIEKDIEDSLGGESVENNNEAAEEIKIQNMKNEVAEELEKTKEELNDINDKYLRLNADFENFKRRNADERTSLYNTIKTEVIVNILPVIDNLEKAAAAESKDEEYKKGVELVYKQFKEVLEVNGLKEIETVGKTFNPLYHEAVSSIQDPKYGPKEIVQEYRKGYMIGDKVVRHSLVIVAN